MHEHIKSMNYTMGYKMGMLDYETGVHHRHNPYEPGTVEYIGWEDGYDDAKLNDYYSGD